MKKDQAFSLLGRKGQKRAEQGLKPVDQEKEERV